MIKILTAGLGTAAILGAGLALAGPASAASLGGSSAADAVADLQARGYSVQINGDQYASLSSCTVTGVHGLTGAVGSPAVPSGSAAYVDVDCNSDHDE